MFVMINAFKSISRSKGRNILIGIIVLVIAVSSCVSLAIRNAAREAEIYGASRITVTGSIGKDFMKVMQGNGSFEEFSKLKDLTLPELQDYAESEHVRDLYYFLFSYLNAGGELEPFGEKSGSEDNSGNNAGMTVITSDEGNAPANGDFTIYGCSAQDAMTRFVSGKATIAKGEMLDFASSEYRCLISAELAEMNGLSVGDTITLSNPKAKGETYTFTIAGLYTDSDVGAGYSQFINHIYLNAKVLENVLEHSASAAKTQTDEDGNQTSTAQASSVSGTFVFSNPENYHKFSEELTAKGLPDYFTLYSPDVEKYEESLIPLKNLSKFATTLLFIVLAIGAVILVVLNVFNIRERKYEVGVLTAMGVKKGKVAAQFVTELLCVTLIAMIIGAGIGSAVSVPAANHMLSAQIEQAQQEQANPNQQGGGFIMVGGSQPHVNYLDQINAVINFSIMGQLIGIGVLLTLISSLAAVIFVMRYEPLRILANRT